MTEIKKKSIILQNKGGVSHIILNQPDKHNALSPTMIEELSDAFENLSKDENTRVLILSANGKSFCAGANFGSDGSSANRSQENNPTDKSSHLYVEAVRLFATKTPIVGAIQGAAIGGGLGLSLVPDFRVACPESRFAANFTRLGFHPGFGLTHTLPALIGNQRATLMFYTSRRIKGEEAYEWGLADMLVPLEEVRTAATDLAKEISENSPLGVMETRATMRQGLADRVRKTTDHELVVQDKLRQTDDFKEGVKAVAERRVPNFKGA